MFNITSTFNFNKKKVCAGRLCRGIPPKHPQKGQKNSAHEEESHRTPVSILLTNPSWVIVVDDIFRVTALLEALKTSRISLCEHDCAPPAAGVKFRDH